MVYISLDESGWTIEFGGSQFREISFTCRTMQCWWAKQQNQANFLIGCCKKHGIVNLHYKGEQCSLYCSA